MLEADQIKREDMKENLTMEYKRRVRKVLQSKLNGGNMIKVINTWAVSLLRYTVPSVEWRRDELKEMDRLTRKMMTTNKALHPRKRLPIVLAKERRTRVNWSGGLC